MNNLFKIIAWISGGIASVLMLLGIIAVLSGGIFMNHFWENYFYPAYHFLLLGIFLFIAIIVNRQIKE